MQHKVDVCYSLYSHAGTHKKLKPTEEVITTMMEYPSATGRRLAAKAHKRIARIDEESLIIHARNGRGAKERDLFSEKDNELWSSTVTKLPENHFAFTMATSVDSLPHNSNICRWGNHHTTCAPSAASLGGNANKP